MAPELWAGEAASVESDVYALGLVLYELLVGQLPHGQLDLTELALFITNYDLPSLSEELPTVPRQLTQLIDRCIQRVPGDRPTMKTIRHELEAMEALYRPFLGATSETPNGDVGRVHASFLRVIQQGDVLARRFYEHFFNLDPSLRALFPSDIGPQAHMLTAALKLTIDSLQDPDRLLAYLSDLGARHARYGVQPRHLGLMGKALLAVLPSVDPEWTDSTAHAWERAYGHIAQLVLHGIENAQQSQKVPPAAVGRAYWEVPLVAPHSTWIQRSSGDLAYQSFGHGAVDIVVLWEWVSCLEQIWQSPRVATFFRHLASLARVTLFDRRGCGLSARPHSPLPLDQQVADILSILDHIGIDRAVYLGMGDGCVPATVLASTRSERTRGLILWAPGRCIAAQEKDGSSVEETTPLIDRQLAKIRLEWGGPVFVETLAPSLAGDASYRRWWSAFLRHSASPSEAAVLFRHAESQSITALLASVRVPSLVLHRNGDRHRATVDSKAIADGLHAAQLQVMPGDDHVPWAGDSDAVLAALHGFLMNLSASGASSNVAGCVLALRTAGSIALSEVEPLVRRELFRHRAITVENSPADTLIAYFDAPLRALQCAVAVQALAATAKLPVAIGLDIGPTSLSPSLSGAAVESAVALSGQAAPGEVLISEAVHTLCDSPEFTTSARAHGLSNQTPGTVYSASASARQPG